MLSRLLERWRNRPIVRIARALEEIASKLEGRIPDELLAKIIAHDAKLNEITKSLQKE